MEAKMAERVLKQKPSNGQETRMYEDVEIEKKNNPRKKATKEKP